MWKSAYPASRVIQWHLADIFTAIKLKRWQAVGGNSCGFSVCTILRFPYYPCCLPKKEDFMSYVNKPFEELDVLDNFLMNAIATDEEVGEAFCRKILSVLLQRPIGKISIVAQYTLPAQNPKYRGIRMDVKVEEFEDGEEARLSNVYDMEPHLQRNLHLPKHNRFYQAKMDSRYLKRGDDNFAGMPNLFVITILNFDPFGYNYMMYTFENRCAEVPDLKYEDGLKFIYFYTGGSKGGNVNLKTLLQYLQRSTAENAMDESAKELHDYVSRIRTAPEVKEEYMRFEELIAFERSEAAKKATEKNTEVVTKRTTIENIHAAMHHTTWFPGIPNSSRTPFTGSFPLKVINTFSHTEPIP